jgi:hypothetical protein
MAFAARQIELSIPPLEQEGRIGLTYHEVTFHKAQLVREPLSCGVMSSTLNLVVVVV